MKTICILGASGMAREAGDVAWALGVTPIYVTNDPGEIAAWRFPERIASEADIDELTGYPFVIGIGENAIREKIALRLSGRVRFVNLIHPSATFGHMQREAVEAQAGVIVCAGARLTSGISVGDFSIINQNATVAHDVIVEEFVHVAPQACVSGNVRLGRGCWIGAGAVVNQGGNQRKLTVGARTVIGSGAVVTEDCVADAVYVGVPAKRVT